MRCLQEQQTGIGGVPACRLSCFGGLRFQEEGMKIPRVLDAHPQPRLESNVPVPTHR
jgi:hypothetical protein